MGLGGQGAVVARARMTHLADIVRPQGIIVHKPGIALELDNGAVDKTDRRQRRIVRARRGRVDQLDRDIRKGALD